VHNSVEALAALVGGTVEGDGKTQIFRARPITHAEPGDITFIEDARNARLLQQSQASAAVVGLDFPPLTSMPLIRVAKPMESFGSIADYFHAPRSLMPPGVHPQASIAASARLGSDVRVGPFVVIGEDVSIGDRCRLMPGVVIGDGCQIGDDVVLYPNVVLYPDTVLGNRVMVHAGSVLGADGFGYRSESGRHVKVPQRGRVEIGDDVEIGASTTVDRATFLTTRVGEGTKIDNQVQIAHNCQVGRHNLIVSQVGLAGSCTTGDYVVIAGQAGIKDHITIGDGAILEAMSGVMADVPAGEKWLGAPAMPARAQFRLFGLIRKLPELREQLNQLTKQVELLERRIEPARKSA
jgi:UDP-3-O-[3-hydroxymyristoyl] glucosamine N-acyltransferase